MLNKILATKNRSLMVCFAVALGVLFASIPEVMAGQFLPLPSTENLDIPTPVGDTASDRFESVLGPLARSIRIIVGALAILLIIVSGFTMILGGESEETVTEQKKSITYGIIGLLMISIAGPIAEVFDFRAGNIVADEDLLVERAQLFGNATQLVVTFLKYMLGSLATLMIVRSGATMITSGSSEEDITREKKNLAMAAGGLFMVIMSDLVVRRVLFDARFNESTSETVVAINQSQFISQLVAFTNLAVSFLAPIMVLGIIIGAVMYATAGGDEERMNKAKQILINSLIGVVIVYGAFALVSTVISGVF